MTSWRRRALWLLGAAIRVVSVAWWWVVFRQVVGSALVSLPRAVHCLVASSDLCTLAQALCSSSNHVLGIRRYETFLFWLGIGALGVEASASFLKKSSKISGGLPQGSGTSAYHRQR